LSSDQATPQVPSAGAGADADAGADILLPLLNARVTHRMWFHVVVLLELSARMVTTAATIHEGRGRFAFTPTLGAKYVDDERTQVYSTLICISRLIPCLLWAGMCCRSSNPLGSPASGLICPPSCLPAPQCTPSRMCTITVTSSAPRSRLLPPRLQPSHLQQCQAPSLAARCRTSADQIRWCTLSMGIR